MISFDDVSFTLSRRRPNYTIGPLRRALVQTAHIVSPQRIAVGPEDGAVQACDVTPKVAACICSSLLTAPVSSSATPTLAHGLVLFADARCLRQLQEHPLSRAPRPGRPRFSFARAQLTIRDAPAKRRGHGLRDRSQSCSGRCAG